MADDIKLPPVPDRPNASFFWTRWNDEEREVIEHYARQAVLADRAARSAISTDVVPAQDSAADELKQKAAIAGALLDLRPIYVPPLTDDILIMQKANDFLSLPAEQGVWSGDIEGIIKFAQFFKAVGHAASADKPKLDDLAQLVAQLVRALRKAAPDNDLSERALGYLKRKGLIGSPLRASADAAVDADVQTIKNAIDALNPAATEVTPAPKERPFQVFMRLLNLMCVRHKKGYHVSGKIIEEGERYVANMMEYGIEFTDDIMNKILDTDQDEDLSNTLDREHSYHKLHALMAEIGNPS